MFRSSCVPPSSSRFVVGLLLAGGIFIGDALSAVKYDIRAVTNDKARTPLGKTKQGSFGSPALNDKGNVAYPCILFGNNVTALTNTAIIYSQAGKKGASAAVLAGLTLDNSFLPNYHQSSTYGVISSAYIYKISKAIAINNKNQIGFAAEVLNQVETDSYQNGVLTNRAFRDDDRADYGVVFPSPTVPGGFQNVCVSIFENFFADILQRTLSINSFGSVPENADFKVTSTRTVPGFDYNYPGVLTTQLFPYGTELIPGPYYTSYEALVATTESNVIGLPYETVFSSFSDAIIADNNRVFVVADISDTGSEFDGLWQGTNPNLQPIVVKQTVAPGTGGKFASFGDKAGPNRKGTAVAFIADITGGSTTRAVFRSNLSGKQVDLIAAVGDQAPGTSGTFTDFELAAVNDRGQVAILGSTGVEASGVTRSGIWVSGATGKNLELIVIAGQTLQIGSKTKTVTRIACNPVAALNKKGKVAFTASFTDKTSAVIVATP